MRECLETLSCALCCAALSLKNNSNQRICGRPKPQEKAPPMNGILQNYLPLVVFIGVAALIGLVLLYYIWPYLVGFLAIVGAAQVYRVWHDRFGR